jgi:hypothetical protein
MNERRSVWADATAQRSRMTPASSFPDFIQTSGGGSLECTPRRWRAVSPQGRSAGYPGPAAGAPHARPQIQPLGQG